MEEHVATSPPFVTGSFAYILQVVNILVYY